MTLRFDSKVTIESLEIIQHTNGVTQVEGFAGNDVADLTSVGRVFGPLGDVTGSSVFTEGSSYVFDFSSGLPANRGREGGLDAR